MTFDEIVKKFRRNVFWLISLAMLYKGLTIDFTEMVEPRNTSYVFLTIGMFSAMLGYDKSETNNKEWVHLIFMITNIVGIIYVASHGI